MIARLKSRQCDVSTSIQLSKAAQARRLISLADEHEKSRLAAKELIFNEILHPKDYRTIPKTTNCSNSRNIRFGKIFSHFDLIEDDDILSDPIMQDLRDWILRPRPEGKKVLITRKGSDCIQVITKDGKVYSLDHHLWKFIPRFTVIEAIDSQSRAAKYLATDVLIWNGQIMMDCEAEMRLFFMQSRVQELVIDADETSGTKLLDFVSFCDAEKEMIRALATKANVHNWLMTNFTLDGVLLMHKSSPYIPGYTTLSVHWRTHKLSAYTSYQINNLECTLAVDQNQLMTEGKKEQIRHISPNLDGISCFLEREEGGGLLSHDFKLVRIMYEDLEPIYNNENHLISINFRSTRIKSWVKSGKVANSWHYKLIADRSFDILKNKNKVKETSKS